MEILRNKNESNKVGILIVDDDIQSRGLLNEFLDVYLPDLNTSVFKAKNGYEALDRIHNNSINLVITDYDMPILNGLELIKEIRAKRAHSQMKIIMLTGSGYCSDIQEAFSLSDAHLFKPLQLQHLSEIISSWYITNMV